ncbi:uncharacterized protein AMSG_11685 [Thecamonas trahens ATCC 50062]|uniref:Tyrosine-protein kinase ephrin type A/B receptor-like domain-containing protein n=1 Tax=Thecamonas trahens ATCC 50062 TaxID=461836 RepID=A0A0L0DVA7_THETB|nr:hypothetical protein AMSG_11685 [Thecamonas trahens ATCC 50062]KNC56082.1 hypothetical protein AMSG_11685 [Thecamonas trahens ATCC 50062]|eukprot:XP_013761224.1 hypothetical protein AMSG_11685 [Thecamonas trahens ATCC 50062]
MLTRTVAAVLVGAAVLVLATYCGALAPPPQSTLDGYALDACTRTAKNAVAATLRSPLTTVTNQAGFGIDAAILDADNDGYPDIATVNYFNASVIIYRHSADNANISFSLAGYIPYGGLTAFPPSLPLAILATDVTGDGLDDLIIGGASPSVQLHINLGGAFAPSTAVVENGIVRHMVFGDVDGDGIDDIVFTLTPFTAGNETVHWVRLTGTSMEATASLVGLITPAPQFDYFYPSYATVAVADLNADGHLDMVASSPYTDKIMTFMTSGTPGAFLPPRPVAFGLLEPIRVIALDVNVDGLPDFAVLARTLGRIGQTLHLNTPGAPGTFDPQPTILDFPLADSGVGQWFEAGDVNGDGNLDIVLSSASLSVSPSFEGAAAGRPPVVYANPSVGLFEPYRTIVADFNGDSAPDILVSTFTLAVPTFDSWHIVFQVPDAAQYPGVTPTFAPPSSFSSLTPGNAIRLIIDTDAAGVPDLLYRGVEDPSVVICFADNTKCVDDIVVLPAFSLSRGIAVGDVNADGLVDAAASLAVPAGVLGHLTTWAENAPNSVEPFSFPPLESYMSFAFICSDLTLTDLDGSADADSALNDVLCVDSRNTTTRFVAIIYNRNLAQPGYLMFATQPTILAPLFNDTLFARPLSANPAADSATDVAYIRANGEVYLALGSPVAPYGINPLASLAASGSSPFFSAAVTAFDVVDLNGDAIDDMLITYGGAGYVAWHANVDAAAPAYSGSSYLVSARPGLVDAVVGDCNRDGHVDVVLSFTTSSSIEWLRGLGSGSFASAAPLVPLPDNSFVSGGITLVDYNVDGALDIVASNLLTSSLQLHLQNSLWSRMDVSTSITVPVERCGYTIDCIGQALLTAGTCNSDTILLPPGTYHNCFRYKPYSLTKFVQLRPLNGVPGSVVLDCTAPVSPDERYLFAVSGGARVVFDGIHIRGARVAVATSTSGGAALSASGARTSLILRNMVFSDCLHSAPISPLVLQSAGGAVTVLAGASIQASNVTFERNVASSLGGALAINDALVVELTDVHFSRNTADDGGALFLAAVIEQSSFASLNRVSFADNVARRGSGGAIYMSGAGASAVVATFNNVTLVRNSAVLDGGAIYADASSAGASINVSVTDFNVESNTAGRDGGAMTLAASQSGASVDARLASGTIMSNSAERGGGGLRIRGETATVAVVDVSVADNAAVAWGGAFATTAKASPDALPDLPLPTLVASTSVSARACAHRDVSSLGLQLSGTTSVENNNAAYGGLAFVCELPMSGAAPVAMTGNAAVGRGNALFVCPPAPGLATCDDAPNAVAPWVAMAGTDLGGSKGSPGVELAFVPSAGIVAPVAELISGEGLTGVQFTLLDVFGVAITDRATSLELKIVGDGASAAQLSTTAALFLTSDVISFANVLVEGAANILSANSQVSVALEAGLSQPAGFALDLPNYKWNVNVSQCPAGRGRTDDARLSSFVRCGLCPGNTYSEGPSVAPCIPCPVGQFALVEGSTSCTLCPPNTAVLASESGNVSLAIATTGGACVCERGFWARSATIMVEAGCVPCPAGASCRGGLALPVALPGSFPTEDPGVFLECPNPSACAGGEPFRCAEGYTGRFCGRCAQDYFVIGETCHKCRGQSGPLIAMFLIGAFVLVCFLVWFNTQQRSVYKFAAVMIGLNSLQISAIYGRLNMQWSSFATAFLDGISFINLNLDLTSPECLANTDRIYFVKYFLIMSSTIIFALIFVVVGFLIRFLVLPRIAKRREAALEEAEDANILTPAAIKDACIRGYYQALVLLYLPLTAMALSFFACREDKEGMYHIEDAPTNACYDSFYWSIFPVALLFVAAYGVGLPVFVVALLRSKRSSLDPFLFVLKFGFLVGRFMDHAWWYEAAILIRKLGVVMAITIFAQVSARAAITRGVLGIALAHLAFLQPYARKQHNILAVVCLASCTAVLWAVAIEDALVRDIMLIVSISINVLAILGGVAYDFVVLRREEEWAEKAAHATGVLGTEMAMIGEGEGERMAINDQFFVAATPATTVISSSEAHTAVISDPALSDLAITEAAATWEADSGTNVDMSSFKPRARKSKRAKVLAPGSRPSVLSGHMLVSSGADEVDAVLGGGLVLGSMVVADEVTPRATSASTLLRLFAAQSVLRGPAADARQPLFLASPAPAAVAAAALPGSYTALPDEPRTDGAGGGKVRSRKAPPGVSDDELRIAWQYKQYAREAAASATPAGSSARAGDGGFVHRFDLGARAGAEAVAAVGVDGFDLDGADGDGLEACRLAVASFLARCKTDGVVGRVAVVGLGDKSRLRASVAEQVRFVFSLGALVRSYGSGVVWVSAELARLGPSASAQVVATARI